MPANLNVKKLTKLGKVLNAFIVRDNIQTLGEVAEKTGITYSHLHQLLYKTKSPTRTTVEKALSPFEMSPKDRNQILAEFDFEEGEKFVRKAPPAARAKVVGTTERYNPKPSAEAELLKTLLAIPEVQAIYRGVVAKKRNENIIKAIMNKAEELTMVVPDEELVEFYEQFALYVMEEVEHIKEQME